MTTKSSCAEVEAAGRRPLVEDADDLNRSAPTRTVLPIGSMPLGSNSTWYGVLPSTTTFARYWTSVPLKKRPAEHRDRVPSAKFSVVPKTTSVLGLLRRGRTRAAASAARRRRARCRRCRSMAPAPRSRARRRSSGSAASAARELGAAGEAGDAELLHEDRVRAELRGSCRAATGRSRGSAPSCRRST